MTKKNRPLPPDNLEPPKETREQYVERIARKETWKILAWIGGGLVPSLGLLLAFNALNCSSEIKRDVLEEFRNKGSLQAKAQMDSLLAASRHVMDQLRYAQSTNTQYTIQTGQTEPGQMWEEDPEPGRNAYITLKVDTKTAFPETPIYLWSLGGKSDHWTLMGVGTVFSPDPKGFRIYISNAKSGVINPGDARQNGWYVQWVAILPTTRLKTPE